MFLRKTIADDDLMGTHIIISAVICILFFIFLIPALSNQDKIAIFCTTYIYGFWKIKLITYLSGAIIFGNIFSIGCKNITCGQRWFYILFWHQLIAVEAACLSFIILNRLLKVVLLTMMFPSIIINKFIITNSVACIHCGKMTKEHSKFCYNCGQPQ